MPNTVRTLYTRSPGTTTLAMPWIQYIERGHRGESQTDFICRVNERYLIYGSIAIEVLAEPDGRLTAHVKIFDPPTVDNAR